MNVLDCGSDAETEEEEDGDTLPQPHAAIQQLAQLYDLVFDDDSSSEDYEANPYLISEQAARRNTARHQQQK